MSDLWLGLSKEHPVEKKPTEEHPAPPAVKKLAAAGEEHPPPAVNAPAVKQPAAAGEGHPAVKQPAEEHPTRTEERHAKQSAASGHSHLWRLSP
ncbi:hypothetical protein BHE74_00037015 [Ensete ventricosum]|nr:hypothetical protein BHE74_00037015 [Ensete ventricosum]